MRQFSYEIYDVFTDTPLTGNALAIVDDADNLTDLEMLQITREFNLSETVFICKSGNPAHSASMRIFTPGGELPFAGHPTVGAAIFVARKRFSDINSDQDAVVVLEEQVGPVRCGVKLRNEGVSSAVFDAPQLPAETSVKLGDKGDIAMALGLDVQDIGFENHIPTSWTAGVPFSFVPCKGLEEIKSIKPVIGLWDAAFGSGDHNNVYVYTRETELGAHQFHARMFAPAMGITEDAATGSAAAAFAGVVFQFDKPADGTHICSIEQGFEMNRPSVIQLELDILGSKMHGMRVGGNAVAVAKGVLSL